MPKSFDELMDVLMRPDGGRVSISSRDAASLLPRAASWLVSDIHIAGRVVTVRTALGDASGSLLVDQHGQLVYDPTTILPDQEMVSQDVADKIQNGLNSLNDRIRRSGLRVADARIARGRIWITTVPVGLLND